MKRSTGRLTTVDLREVWANESSEFTPWLAEQENLALLGEAVGMDLELQAQEKRVGIFRADILCKDLASGGWVLIENQLERSDHTHLGQLLTYAAGLETATIIWVAPKFCDEHRAALDWLNSITGERFNFFAVEVEAWSISGSLPAPRFTVAARPNGWNRTVKRTTAELEQAQSESGKRRMEYWETFLSALKLEHSEIKLPKPNSLGNLWFNLRGRNLWVTVYASTSVRRMGVFLRGKQEYYDALYRKRSEIEAQLRDSPTWDHEGDGYWAVSISKHCDPTNRTEWPQQHKWLSERLNDFIRVFKPYLAKLP